MRFLFYDILTFTGNNVNPQPYCPLLQSLFKVFLCLKYIFNLMVVNCQGFGYSVLVARNLFIIIFLTSNMVIPGGKKYYLFYQSCRVSSCGSFVDDRNGGAILFYFVYEHYEERFTGRPRFN